MKTLLKKIFQQPAAQQLAMPAFRKSYAQHGEDLLVEHLLRVLQVERPFFIDVGAHHPYLLSNTYLLYEQGARGVNVEPDPSLIAAFRQYRPLDTNLPCGVRFDERTASTLYIMSSPVLNTFSRQEAEHVAAFGTYSITGEVQVPLLSLADIMAAHCPSGVVDFISIDVEGLDWEIIQYNQLDAIRPKVLCVETMRYTESGIGQKNTNLIQYLTSIDYQVHADTGLNTIFVDSKLL
ncbi:MAG: FkbM family methyltransferase [Chitinophagaceae bacterium]|nr:FkbM family methyltransferase [Chitinophagaceae bacterium]